MEQLKVYLKPHAGLSRAMDRVATALTKTLPEPVTLVYNRDEATHVVLHVTEFQWTAEAIMRCRMRGQRYILIQYHARCLEQSMVDWLPLWRDAELVWSYYDLPALCLEDGLTEDEAKSFKFYHAPLGVDPTIFQHRTDLRRKWKCITTGTIAASESVAEVEWACQQVDGWHLHLGQLADHRLKGKKSTTLHHVPDETLAMHYGAAEYVSGLRRIEGFELPAAEGLLCGARPILYDRPHYRQWYDEWAFFIHEGPPEQVQAQLVDILSDPAPPLSEEEIAAAAARFDWHTIGVEFWVQAFGRLLPTVLITRGPRRKLLWVGDAVVASGFAKCTHEVLNHLQADWDVHVLGLNYHGDPYDQTKHPYPVYPAHTGGDLFGVGRLAPLVTYLAPDVVVIQNDPWNIPPYLKKVGNVPVVGIIAVDGLNCQGSGLNGLAGAIFWTEFGKTEAQRGGYTGPAYVVPLGVDLKLYTPQDRVEARRHLGLPPRVHNAFVVGNVNRNQPRKRLDLTMQYFAHWVHEHKIPDAYLYMHVCPTGDVGYDVSQFAQYYKISNRLILQEPPIGPGISEDKLVWTYNAFDVQVSTTQGEGFGLTTLEGMACGIPQLVPEWSALAEWAKGAAALVPCFTTVATPRVNVLGGVPDADNFIAALQQLYEDVGLRQRMSEEGRRKALQDQYRWADIARDIDMAINLSLAPVVMREAVS